MLIKSTLLDENESTFSFPENLLEGIYFIKLNVTNGSVTKKVVLTK
jgi:hypothetical protein